MPRQPPHRKSLPARRRPQQARTPSPDVPETESGATIVVRRNVQVVQPQNENTTKVPFARLLRVGAKFFSGTTNPIEADNWFRGTEIKLAAGMISEEDKVSCTGYLFQDNASYWWDSVNRKYQGQPNALTWEILKKEFYDKYMPRTFRDNMKILFTKLEQGSMTVTEYEQKFVEYSSFAPSYVEDESEKCQRFVDGLHEDIRTAVAAACHTEYLKVVDSALQAERSKTRKQIVIEAQPASYVASGSKSFQSKSSFPSRNSQFKAARMFKIDTPRSQTSLKQECKVCGKSHRGRCLKGSGVCYYCGSPGHVRRDCPLLKQASNPTQRPSTLQFTSGGGGQQNARTQSIPTRVNSMVDSSRVGSASGGYHNDQFARQDRQARVFSLTQQEAQTNPDVVTGILRISGHDAHILIDPGATHSFVSSRFACHFMGELGKLDASLVVMMPLGNSCIVKQVYRSCNVQIGDHNLVADLIPLEIWEFDVIFGMDWLSFHHAIVDCFRKEVTFNLPMGKQLVFHGERRVLPSCVISATIARKLLRKGCEAYLASVIDTRISSCTHESFPTAHDFQIFFLKNSQVCHLIRRLNSLLNYFPVLHQLPWHLIIWLQ